MSSKTIKKLPQIASRVLSNRMVLVSLAFTTIIMKPCPAANLSGQYQEIMAGIDKHSSEQQSYLQQRLEEIRLRNNLPALAAALVTQDDIKVAAVAGYRRFDSDDPVKITDAFQIGSITKTMTATLFAVLLDKGSFRQRDSDLNWDTTLSEFYRNDKVFMDVLREGDNAHQRAAYEHVTVAQLFAHLGKFPTGPLSSRRMANVQSLTEQRQQFVLASVSDAPVDTNGFHYGSGSVIVAAMMERVMGQPWEELIQEHLFSPLGMHTASAGTVSSGGKVEGVWEHVHNIRNERIYGCLLPNENYVKLVDAPAGPNLQCSVIDMAKYLTMHLKNEVVGSTEPFFKDDHSFKRLHEKVNGQRGPYSYGAWKLSDQAHWYDGKQINVSNHSGSNRRNLAYSCLYYSQEPAQSFAFCTMCNASNIDASAARVEMSEELIQIKEHWDLLPYMHHSLAQGKPTTGFNVYRNAKEHQPQMATDGRLSTRWASVGNATQENPFWLQIDLEEVQDIGRIIVLEEIMERTKNFQIEYSQDGNHWQTVFRRSQSRLGPNWVFDLERRGAIIKARYVRLNITAGRHPTISEFILLPPE